MAHWDVAQGQAEMAKIRKNTPVFDAPPRKTQTQNEINFFFSIWTTRLAESVEGLNSSLAQSPGELQDCKALQEKWRTRD